MPQVRRFDAATLQGMVIGAVGAASVRVGMGGGAYDDAFPYGDVFAGAVADAASMQILLFKNLMLA